MKAFDLVAPGKYPGDGRDGRAHLLVLEDSADLRELWEIEFERWRLPARLTLVDDGFRAVVAMANDPPDLVITDISMPGALNGRALVEIMERTPPYDRTPIIVLSGEPADELLDRPSVIACFRKPTSFRDLRRFIETRYPLFARQTPIVAH